MFLRKKGQSTAEYAILIGLVIAVAAGILQVALKGGVRQKNKQALDLLLNAGSDNEAFTAAVDAAGDQGVSLYSQEYRKTEIKGGADYVDEATLLKGGGEERRQKQVSSTDTVSIETMEAAGTE